MSIDFFNPRSVILAICLLQGLIFAALLFVRGRSWGSMSDLWFSAILIVMCSGLITALIGFADVYYFYQGLTFFPFELVFALAPCIYLYVLSMTNAERRFSSADLVHFVPAAIYIVYRLSLFGQSLDFKDWYDDNIQVPVAQPIQNVLVLIWNATYLYLAIRHYYRYRRWLEHNVSNTGPVKFDWLRNFLFLFAGLITVSTLFDLTSSFIVKLSYRQIFYYEVTLACLVYYLAIAGYLRSGTTLPSFVHGSIASLEGEQQSVAARKREILSADDVTALKEKLSRLMEQEKPFLEPDLVLGDLGRQMGINAAALSYLINKGFDQNFNDFINEYRIEEFKGRMRTGSESGSLLKIAFECGFNSKATFNRAFKKSTGRSPSQFDL